MALRAFIWSAKCLGLCVAGIFICGQVTGPATSLIWWLLHRTNETHLNRQIFQFRYFLILRVLYGFLLGLIPINLCIEVFRSLFGMFRSPTQTLRSSEMDWRRPLLWAWAPLAVIFAFQFMLWRAPDQSVLSADNPFERFDYFFDPMTLGNLSYLSPQASGLVFTFVIITGPMVFLLAYAIGVWLRHQRPLLQHSLAEEIVDPAEQPTDAH